MGFCNETLNVELLIKNNFDIQRTVRELFFSIGNNLSYDASSPTLATSASDSTNNHIGSNQIKEKKCKSLFSVDSSFD